MTQSRGPAEELRATIDRLPLDVRQGVLDGIRNRRIIAGAHVDGSGGVCPMMAAEDHVHWKTVSKANVKVAQDVARAWDRYAQAMGHSRAASKRQLLALTSMLEASILLETDEVAPAPTNIMAEFERSRSRIPMSRSAPEVGEESGWFTSTPAPRVAATRLREPIETPYLPEPVEALPEPVEAMPEPVARPSIPEPTARPRLRKRRDTGERDRSQELGEREGWAWLRPFRSYDEYEETLLAALAELGADERELEEVGTR